MDVQKAMTDSALKRAFDKSGFPRSKLCGVDGLDYCYAYKQYMGQRGLSAEYALVYERLFGIPRSELRPDLWPPQENLQDAPTTEASHASQ